MKIKNILIILITNLFITSQAQDYSSIQKKPHSVIAAEPGGANSPVPGLSGTNGDSLIVKGQLQYGIRNIPMPSLIIRDEALYNKAFKNQFTLIPTRDLHYVFGQKETASTAGFIMRGGKVVGLISPVFHADRLFGGAVVQDFVNQPDSTFTVFIAFTDTLGQFVDFGYRFLDGSLNCYRNYRGPNNNINPRCLVKSADGKIYYMEDDYEHIDGSFFTGQPRDTAAYGIWQNFGIDSAGTIISLTKSYNYFDYHKFNTEYVLNGDLTNITKTPAIFDLTHSNYWGPDLHGGPLAAASLMYAGVAIINPAANAITGVMGGQVQNDYTNNSNGVDTVFLQHNTLLFGDTLLIYNDGRFFEGDAYVTKGDIRISVFDNNTHKVNIVWQRPLPDTLRATDGSFRMLPGTTIALVDWGGSCKYNAVSKSINAAESYGIVCAMDMASGKNIAELHWPYGSFTFAWNPATYMKEQVKRQLSEEIHCLQTDSGQVLHSPWGASFWQFYDSNGVLKDLGWATNIIPIQTGTYWASKYISNFVQATGNYQVQSLTRKDFLKQH